MAERDKLDFRKVSKDPENLTLVFISSFSHLTGLITLKFRILREDLISLYKILNGTDGMKEALGKVVRLVGTSVHKFPIFMENRQNKYSRNFLAQSAVARTSSLLLCPGQDLGIS